MNKMNKKGFTIVELVIVIAVIAILAGVLIPTFGGIIDRANASAEMQKVAAAYKEAYGVAFADGKIDTTDFEEKTVNNVKEYHVTVNGVEFVWEAVDGDKEGEWDVVNKNSEFTYTYDKTNNTWKVEVKK